MYPDKKVFEVVNDFKNHTNTWVWYFKGKYVVEFQSNLINENTCLQAKKSIMKLMESKKTPIEIIPVLHFWNIDNIEKCKFVVKRL